jgi:hypothetical protein
MFVGDTMFDKVAAVTAGVLWVVVLTVAGLKLDPVDPNLGAAVGAAIGALTCMSVQLGWFRPKK